jgi:hypothetical protein
LVCSINDSVRHKNSFISEHDEYLQFLPGKHETKEGVRHDWNITIEKHQNGSGNVLEKQDSCTNRLLNYILEKKGSSVFQSFFFILAVGNFFFFSLTKPTINIILYRFSQHLFI